MQNKQIEIDGLKARILEYSLERFLREGFHKITMDSIAQDLGISKKSIYKEFESKDELIKSVVLSMMNRVGSAVQVVIEDKNLDTVHKTFNLFGVLLKHLIQISDTFFKDIKMHSNYWKLINDFRTERINKFAFSIIQEGKKSGLFKDLPTPLMVKVFLTMVTEIVNPDFIMQSNIPLKAAMQGTLDLVIDSFLTEKGRKLYKKIKNEKRDEEI